MTLLQHLQARAHIQDFHSGQNVEHHWGYADRIVPCTNDAGTCEYLDTVYHSHDLSMAYSWILWVVLLSILISLVALRFLSLGTKTNGNSAKHNISLYRYYRTICTIARRHTLPETPLSGLWRHTTRLQILILSILLAYLLIFSLVGITYKTWITPVKSNPSLHSVRSGLGGWSDRVGVLAYALTPLVVFLSARESILSLATGIPSHHFLFLHAWTGRIIFVQSFLHTLGWTLIEGYFYQPQPYMYTSVMSEQYIIFGCVAMLLVTILLVFSMQSVIRRTGYEVFRKLHYGVAILYLGACWGHWQQLACWMIASLIVIVLDRALRLLRVIKLHLGRNESNGGLLDLYPLQARITIVSGDGAADCVDDPRSVLRLDIPISAANKQRLRWQAGQHFYICFPEHSVWQSHPFTVASSPNGDELSFIIRTHAGATAQLLAWACDPANLKRTISVVLTGPYNPSPLRPSAQENILAIAGGTGITYTLPLALKAASQSKGSTSTTNSKPRAVEHIWIVRHARDLNWLPEREMQRVKTLISTGSLRLRVFVTREACESTSLALPLTTATEGSTPASTASGTDVKANNDTARSTPHNQCIASTPFPDSLAGVPISYATHDSKHPSIEALVSSFIADRADQNLPTKVLASGPASLLGDVRVASAKCNDWRKVWRGDERWGVEVWCDGRMG